MTSFASDIAPMFVPFRCPMTWRLDLTNYLDVKANAALVLQMILSTPASPGTPFSPAAMPPLPFEPLSDDQVNLFQQWQSEGCPA